MGLTCPLLKNTTHQTTGLLRKIFQRRRSGIAVETTHGHTEQGSTCQELAICTAESSSLWEVSALCSVMSGSPSICYSSVQQGLQAKLPGGCSEAFAQTATRTSLQPSQSAELGAERWHTGMTGRGSTAARKEACFLLTSSRIMKRMLLTTNGHLRP